MPQPTNYTPTTDFSQQEAINASGRSTVNTAALDTELANIETTLDQTLANLAVIQRDDGKLADLSTQLHTLSPEVLNLMGGFRLTGIWAASTDYLVSDICSNGEYTYVCTEAHTSGLTFEGAYWVQFGFSGGGDASQAAAEAQISANNAAASALAASGSSTTASGHATTATAQAGLASDSAVLADARADAASISETNAANSASTATTAAANLPNATTAGASKFLQSNSGGTGWDYKTASQTRTALGIQLNYSFGFFYKTDSASVAFTKTGAGTATIKAGTKIDVLGTLDELDSDTAITMPTLSAGTDYTVWLKDDTTIQATTNHTSAPAAGNWRKIGGFHYGLVAPGTTVAGGSFNTAGSPVGGGMVWTQGDVDKIAGINQWSFWDLKFRPVCSDPRGMVLVNNCTWVDIYLCSTDTAANGTSKYNTNIASGTVLPKVPAAFGGNGTLTYATLNWWEANELARANQKRLLLTSEFYDAAFGVTENQAIDATASTYPTTLRNAGYTSKYGIEQASGHHWVWCQDSAGSASVWVANGGRGQSSNNNIARVILGGARTFGAYSGSRCSHWGNVSSISNWNVGLRAAADHMAMI